MSGEETFLIVGAGLAGARLAEELRARDCPGRILLIGAEEHLPYERPPLSKDYFAGRKQLADFTVHDGDWYRDHRVELLLGTKVTAIDPAAHTVTLPDGSTLRYDKLALATGSTPRTVPIPGADAERVYVMRTVEDSDALLAAIHGETDHAGWLAVIGAGWIGMEIAANARGRGAGVVVAESAKQPLLGALGEEMGAVFADLHRAHGVDLRTSTSVREIVAYDGRASGIRFGDGSVVPADAVLVAVGAQPNIDLARDAGLAVDDGVLVDASLRTSDPDIVAVGDIASVDHPLLRSRVRVEHWANALNQPAVAAATMLGREAAYDRLPYFFTDQYDLGMEYVGLAPPDARVVTRGDVTGLQFLAFWLDDEHRVRAGMNVNIWDAGDDIRALITSGRPVDADRLADTTVPLSDVAP
ncbi:ferredoxin--NAD(+) reductase [Rhodococcus gordoniae]|uniref:Ferredoxin--NAD(+) reductase n=1 Tax=Rhodococcus gordoniae TaxID=223392 RepID=A0A379LVD5_9NOCA|nr:MULTISPECIES: FAD-dependent oxidoreductase [Rhodococcus]UTT50094.1 FAD-dependent oxidoreductase [Rhodococcus gordoniae]SUE13506.1 ferredoxin--NAD(+) reductase [Rhodococcus gordoniae]